MEKKKRSFGSLFLGFIRSIISLLLVLILIVSVGENLLFYSEYSSPKIDFMGYHYTFFINNSYELEHIGKGSLVMMDHKSEPEANTYVLCSVGSGHKTVLCLSSITENTNGTLSYNVRGDKQGSVSEYSLPESKVLGTVMIKMDIAGEIIRFMKDIPGLATLMAIPSFLLIILSVFAIRRKRAIYDDELLESEIFLEELRKTKRNEEKKAEEQKKAQSDIAPATTVSSGSDIPFEEYARSDSEKASKAESAAKAPESRGSDYIDFEDEAARKAIEIKNAIIGQKAADKKPEQPAVSESKEPYKSDNHDAVAAAIAERKQQLASIYNEQLNPDKPVFQEIPEPARPSYKYDNTVRNFANIAEVKHSSSSASAETPKKPAATGQTAPVKKKTKPPVKKIDADSIDDLIKILEDEKKKLD